MEKFHERRALNRIEVPGALVRYKFNKGLGALKNFNDAGELLNLSKSGIAFFVKEKVDFGTPVHLKIRFPDGNDVALKGKIRWQKNLTGNGRKTIGIQFNPFGQNGNYNPVQALEYLRSMKELAITHHKRTENAEEE